MRKPYKGPERRQISSARQKLMGRVVGGSYSELANYGDLFRRTQDAILLVDAENLEILEPNPAATLALGESTEKLTGASLPSFFSSEDSTRIRALDSGERIDLTLRGRVYECVIDRVKLADYCEAKQVILKDVTEVRLSRKLLEAQSTTDEMTGLPNFRSFRTRLSEESALHQRNGTPFSVIFCDIDHFKSYNDKNGHPAGDQALVLAARIIREIAGSANFAARYGGEEFVVLLPGVGAEQARLVADAIRRKIESTSFPHGEKQPLGRVTLSLGVADTQNGPDADSILKAADDALYRAKQGGRNQVALASKPDLQAA